MIGQPRMAFHKTKVYGPKFYTLLAVVVMSAVLKVQFEGDDAVFWMLPLGQLIVILPLYVWFRAFRNPEPGISEAKAARWGIVVIGTGLIVALAISMFSEPLKDGLVSDWKAVLLVWVQAFLFVAMVEELLCRDLLFALYPRHSVLPVMISAIFSAISVAASSMLLIPFGFAMGLWLGILRYKAISLFVRVFASGTVMVTLSLLWFGSFKYAEGVGSIVVFSIVVMLIAFLTSFLLILLLRWEQLKGTELHLHDAHLRAAKEAAEMQQRDLFTVDHSGFFRSGLTAYLHRRGRILVRRCLLGSVMLLLASTVILLMQSGNTLSVSAGATHGNWSSCSFEVDRDASKTYGNCGNED